MGNKRHGKVAFFTSNIFAVQQVFGGVVWNKQNQLLRALPGEWRLNFGYIDIISSKSHSNRCKIPSDNVPIGSGTLTRELGGVNIWTFWSNGNCCNLEGWFLFDIQIDCQQRQNFGPLLLYIPFFLRSCKYFTKLPSSLTP